MGEGLTTTAAVQTYLDELARADASSSAEPVVRKLLEKAIGRLHLLCATLLHRSYPRLTRPPVNLDADELLGAVVERLLRAMKEVRPGNVRQFFALANQHMRWELNDLARRLDQRTAAGELPESGVLAPERSDSSLSSMAQRILGAIEGLPEEERETFSLVRIQGMSQDEAAEVLAVSLRTVQRRLSQALVFLTKALGDLQPLQAPRGDS